MTWTWDCVGPHGVVQHIRRDKPTGGKAVYWVPQLRGRSSKDYLYSPVGVEGLPLPIGVDVDWIVITEGEKDADAAHALGLLAIGTCTGASSAPSAETFAWAGFAGRRVLVWPDADDPGTRHAHLVAAQLAELDPPADVHIVDPTGLELTGGAGAADVDSMPIERLLGCAAPRPADWAPVYSAATSDPFALQGEERVEATVDDIVRAHGHLQHVGHQWQGACPTCGGEDRWHVLDAPGANGRPVMHCRQCSAGFYDTLSALGLTGLSRAPGAPSRPSTAAAGGKGSERFQIRAGLCQRGLEEMLRQMRVEARYNARAGRIEIRRGKPTWTPIDDRREAALREEIRRDFEVLAAGRDDNWRPAKFSDADWRLAMHAAVLQHEVDPVRVWLDSLPEWDGDLRLDTLLFDLWGCDSDLAAWASRYLVLGAIQRTLEPGCLLRELPVLIGEQGSGKSALVRAMAADDEWHSDSLDFTDRSQARVESTLGKLYVEASEMAGIARQDIEPVKAYISRRSDYVRLAYARHPEDRKRRFIIVGTANDTGSGVLPQDASGNTRFVPIRIAGRSCVGKVEDWVAARRDQLFAEALHRWQAGERANLDDELREAQAAAVEEHERVDAGIEERLDSIVIPVEFTLRDIVRALGEPASWVEKNAHRLEQALRRRGCGRVRREGDDQSFWVWRR